MDGHSIHVYTGENGVPGIFVRRFKTHQMIKMHIFKILKTLLAKTNCLCLQDIKTNQALAKIVFLIL